MSSAKPYTGILAAKTYDMLYRAVLNEIKLFVDAETYDEKSHLGEMWERCMAILALRFDDVSAWDEAFVDAPYSRKWSGAECMQLLMDDDTLAFGQELRRCTIAAFAEDIFNSAYNEMFS